jgi:preprotein translocase subunit SecD
VSGERRDWLKSVGLSSLALWCTLPVASIWSISLASAQPVVLEVARAEARFDQRTNAPIVAITLTEASARLFGEFTAKNVGRMTELRVDGRVVSRLVIREPILGGQLQISGQLTVEEARDIADRLSRGAAKVEVEVVPS